MQDNVEKLELKPKPNRYCPTCLGYGVIEIIETKNFRLDKYRSKAVYDCGRCGGTGWVYEDK